MEKTQKSVFLALIMLMNMALVQCGYWETAPYQRRKRKITYLQFYIHDILSGTDPTALVFARANNTLTGPIPLGTAFAVDDPLTEGPERTSKVIGNGRGMYLDLDFTSGKFSGSSLSVFSRNLIREKDRDMVVVGGRGRGRFRYVEGFVKIKTQFMNITNGDA